MCLIQRKSPDHNGTRRLENDVYLLDSVHLQITNKYNTHIDKCNVINEIKMTNRI